MLNNIIKLFIFYIFSFLFISCGASTGSRYDKKEDKPRKEESEPKFETEFDMSRYHATIDVNEIDTESNPEVINPDIWYEYSETDTTQLSSKTIVERVEGYRVQVFSTDNLDDANEVRSELYFKTIQKNVYVIFDPPFYKVKVGDIINLAEANELNFKLTQMGFSESRVVKDSINIFQ